MKKYDAFISYRHIYPDKLVAKKIQRLLEGYRPPSRTVCENKKRIRRVFRDESELSLSEDLGEKIEQALSNSDYLIVVCSEETKNSKWCLREIEYFKKLHGNKNDHILTVVTAKDALDAFPKQICEETQDIQTENGSYESCVVQVEPFAANIYDETAKKMKRKLNQEYLRIVAPMLGCDYDDLYRRHQRRLIKKILITASLVAGFLFLFSAYVWGSRAEILRQATEIQEKNDALEKANQALEEQIIQTQLQKARAEENERKANENYLLANQQKEAAEQNLKMAVSEKNLRTLNVAQRLIENGDKVMATMLLQGILKETDAPSAYLKSEVYRLLSKSTYQPKYKQYLSLQINGDIRDVVFDKEENLAFVATSDGTVQVYDAKSGKLIHTVRHQWKIYQIHVNEQYLTTIGEGGKVARWNRKDFKLAHSGTVTLSSYPENGYDLLEVDESLFMIHNELIDHDTKYFVSRYDYSTGETTLLASEISMLDFSKMYEPGTKQLLFTEPHAVYLYDIQTGKKECKYQSEEQEITDCYRRRNPDGEEELILLFFWSEEVVVFHPKTKTQQKFLHENGNIWCTAMSPDQRFFAMANYPDGQIAVVDLNSTEYKIEKVYNPDVIYATGMRFLSENEILIRNGFDGNLLHIYKRNEEIGQFTLVNREDLPERNFSASCYGKKRYAIANEEGVVRMFSLQEDAWEQEGSDYPEVSEYNLIHFNEEKLLKKENGALVLLDRNSRLVLKSVPVAENQQTLGWDGQLRYGILKSLNKDFYWVDMERGTKKKLNDSYFQNVNAIKMLDATSAVTMEKNRIYKLDIFSGKKELLSSLRAEDIDYESIYAIKPDLGNDRIGIVYGHPRSTEEYVRVFILSSGETVFQDEYFYSQFSENTEDVSVDHIYYDRNTFPYRLQIPSFVELMSRAGMQAGERKLTQEELKQLNLN